MPAFMAELSAIKSVAARALEFTVLTAVRSNEALQATWDESDSCEALDHTSGANEGRKEHVVPLSSEAISLLKSLPREHSPWIFIGKKNGQSLAENAMRKVLERIAKDITVHGFRSTFRTVGQREKTNIANQCLVRWRSRIRSITRSSAPISAAIYMTIASR